MSDRQADFTSASRTPTSQTLNRSRLACLLLLLGLAGLAGCSEPESSDAGDMLQGNDATQGPDAGRDAGADSGRDAGPDAGRDSGPDSGRDASPDSGRDSGPDAGPACNQADICDPDSETPVCDLSTGRCVRCLPDTHAGCGADELCCEDAQNGAAEGERACRPTTSDGDCEACGVACGPGADACQDRGCVCGAGGAACGGATPLCIGGACVACAQHADCGANNLCCNGACLPTSLDACADCGSGCAADTATACVNRACKCGDSEACTGTSGLCLTADVGGPARCGECDTDARCTADPARPQCVNDLCQACDAADSAGCDEASSTPICGPGNTCAACQNDAACAQRPGDLDFCLADGACHACTPDLDHTLATDTGCTALAPVCEAGACRACQRDAECPDLCVEGQCAGCDPRTNAGCSGATPICNAQRICEPCSREANGDGVGGRVGDAACNLGLPEGAPARICTVQRTCEICDVGGSHRGCGLDSLCCVGAGGVPDCQPAEFAGANGCESCGTACDADLSNVCSDRRCLCDAAGEACGGGLLCVGSTGTCQSCRDNADCPLDSQCCQGLCVGTGPGAANICTGCEPGADACDPLATSTCTDRVCGCGDEPECAGDRPVCADLNAQGLAEPDRALHSCVACLQDAHCAGVPGRQQCVNQNCVACDADLLAYDGCDETAAAPICVGGNCLNCNSNLDCQTRPGALDLCDGGRCVACVAVAPGATALGCNESAPICDGNLCRPCIDSAECGAERQCVGGTCENCDPAGNLGCGGAEPVCDASTLSCRGCVADAECPEGNLCTPADGRCVACDLASHRGCGGDQLCCGALPGQTCVALDLAHCTGCTDGACDPDTANHCAPRAGENTVGSCACGDQGACSADLPWCDGEGPLGGCVGCRVDSDCFELGLTQCVSDGFPENDAEPARCRVCDPEAPAELSGCDFAGEQPFCHRVGNMPNQEVSCLACADDAECVDHPSGTQCVASGACRDCDPAEGAQSAGCDLASRAPICGGNFTCRGCADDTECAATAGNGDRCHAPVNGGDGTCFACDDGVKNGSEAGIDCGGPDCAERCGPGQGCTDAARDCASGVCTAGLCTASACDDGVFNGTETAVDCGGSCPVCADGSACGAAEDCQSGVCVAEICQVPTCIDGVRNGTEIGIDCRGSCPNRCPADQPCVAANDCDSGVCSSNLCAAPTCNDAVRNSTETAIDCGGNCPACADGSTCGVATDCVSGVCAENLCAMPTCNDTVRNGTETAVDCGGSCPACADGSACGVAADCVSGVCTGNLCQAPTCNDTVRNGTETAMDCGGSCPACADGLACGDATDCVSGVCMGNVCQAPACNDGVRNGNESGVDCGGSCPGCPLQGACTADTDCVLGDVCVGNVCVDCKNGDNTQCTVPASPVCVGTGCQRCDSTDGDGCGDATPACLNNTTCVQCTNNRHCTAGTICTANQCVPGIEWIYIGAGTFSMGSPAAVGFGSEHPQHRVMVPAFRLARTEVTVAQYRACVTATACTAPSIGDGCNWNVNGRDNHPVNCVDWTQAKTYATWVGGGARLPTEAEWEYAARSGGANQTYPWGNAAPTCGRAVMVENDVSGCGQNSTWPVCSKPNGNSAQGVCDLSGNVFEWIQDWYHNNYNGAPEDGRAWVIPPTVVRVIRGGSWVSTADSLRAASRNRETPSFRYNNYLGFRLAR